MSGWIPVSGKLPEIGQTVLVTSYGRIGIARMISNDGFNSAPVFRLWMMGAEMVVSETTAHSEFTAGRITAWMPIDLPEPYKAESEVQE